jgi:hypothetical protein
MSGPLDTSRFITEFGCTIIVVPAPDHLGDGVLMTLRMEQAGDGRWCEVYLDRENMRTLRALLDEEVG